MGSSQLQAKAFASSQMQPKAGDWCVNRQNPSDMFQLISLMGSEPELACSDSLPLSKEVGSYAWTWRGQGLPRAGPAPSPSGSLINPLWVHCLPSSSPDSNLIPICPMWILL